MMRVLTYILMGVIAILVIAYMQTYQPELLDEIITDVDVFGWTPQGAQEKERRASINDLTIPYEQKQVLLHHTVFLDATPDMVKLALGLPQNIVQSQDAKAQTKYIYYLPGDMRPTVLVFEKDAASSAERLISAYKGSAVDIQLNARGSAR